ncbi:transcriptional regulator, GntR family [Bacillus sp. OV194]|nr:transcriptional regulator, GntR family [Bacillus sp. OV194]
MNKTEASDSKLLKMKAYTILKEAIIRGELKDNEMITERRAQEQFNISRTPFREAVQTLEAENWVQIIPYKGTQVKPITFKDINDLFELRFMLEPAIVRKAEDFIDEGTLNRLKQITESMNLEMQNDFKFITLDREFHHLIYQSTNNQRIIGISEQISDMTRRIGMRGLYRAARRLETIKEHIKIIEGIETGNSEQMMIEHLERTKQTCLKLYREG